jgi:hypothetical protein
LLDADALRRFAADMSAAFNRLADSLTPPAAADRPRFVPVEDVSGLLRGSRQKAVFKYLRTVGDDGATTAQINDSIAYDFSNTYTTVHRLKELGFIEMVPDTTPQTWRIAKKWRRESLDSA